MLHASNLCGYLSCACVLRVGQEARVLQCIVAGLVRLHWLTQDSYKL